MKNLFLSSLNIEEKEIEIDGESFHHFRNVTRGKKGEQVQVFNGEGLIAKGHVAELGKKSLTVQVEDISKIEKIDSPTLIIGIPKKEYLESIVRSAIQTGIFHIKLVTTEYTPWKYKFYDRLQKIMESSLIQSENPYLPILEEYKSLDEALDSFEGETLVFSTEVLEGKSFGERPVDSLLIGPEGGFSGEEVEYLKTRKDVTLMRCSIPIMKAEVAVPFGIGLLYGHNNT